jgi:crossover junction endodeoxyribonuclease RuvC
VTETYAGIDPGKEGAIAVIYGRSVEFWDAPTLNVGKGSKRAYDEAAMVEILKNLRTATFGLELVHSMPGQGVASMFSQGEGFGLWKGILSALETRWQLVTPQAWKKALMAGQPKEKASSVLVASRLFPNAQKLLRGPRGRALDGRADALLIAEYVRRLHEAR